MLLGEYRGLEVPPLLRFVAVQVVLGHVQVPRLAVEQEEVPVRLRSVRGTVSSVARRVAACAGALLTLPAPVRDTA